jgi:hypothetical protein
VLFLEDNTCKHNNNEETKTCKEIDGRGDSKITGNDRSENFIQFAGMLQYLSAKEKCRNASLT